MVTLTMPGEHYVYALLDHRKPGPFRYGRWEFPAEPFYIGKGKGGRAYQHLDPRHNYNKFKSRLVAKIIRDTGEEPIVHFVRMHMPEANALALEIKLIGLIGRRNLKQGPLVNLTDGGEGATGKIWSKAERAARSVSSKRYWADLTPEQREAVSLKFRQVTRRTHQDYLADVAVHNPTISVLDTFVSYSETRTVRIRMACGCEAVSSARILTAQPLRRASCFTCELIERLSDRPHGLTLLNRPTNTRSKAQYRCESGHEFEQEARCNYYGGKQGCPRCNEQYKPTALNAEQVAAIRADTRQRQVLADEYGVAIETISHVRNRRGAYANL